MKIVARVDKLAPSIGPAGERYYAITLQIKSGETLHYTELKIPEHNYNRLQIDGVNPEALFEQLATKINQ